MTPRSEGEILEISNMKNYSFSERKMVTRNFRPDNVLGEGGFGSVFKGRIDDHLLTATRLGTGIVHDCCEEAQLRRALGSQGMVGEYQFPS
jgi:hypothetical protein